MEEDYAGRETQRTELTQSRQGLLEQMASFKENYKEELQLFFEELEIEEQLSKIQSEKSKAETKLGTNEKLRKELSQRFKDGDELSSKLQKQLETNEDAMLSALSKDSGELAALEGQLQKRMQEADCEVLSKIVMDEAQKRGFDYGKALFIVQKKLVEKELEKVLV